MNDLLKKYVTTGKSIPPNQLDKLNKNLLYSYYNSRKRYYDKFLHYEIETFQDFMLEDKELHQIMKMNVEKSFSGFEVVLSVLPIWKIPYDIFLSAVKKLGDNIYYIGSAYKLNEVPMELLLEAVKQNGMCLEYVNDLFSEGKVPFEVMREALIEKPEAELYIEPIYWKKYPELNNYKNND